MYAFRSEGFAQRDKYSSRFVTEWSSGNHPPHLYIQTVFEDPISSTPGALRCVATRPTIDKFRVARSISSRLSWFADRDCSATLSKSSSGHDKPACDHTVSTELKLP